MGRRERLLLVVAALVAALVIGFGFGRSTASFHWTATGTLTYHARCSKEGHAQVPDTCAFQVPNPPTLAKKITLDVRVHNTSAVRHCYGLSVTTSYLSGLQSFCVKPHASGGYETTNVAKYFIDVTLDLFVSTSSANEPLAPIKTTSRSAFRVTFSQARN